MISGVNTCYALFVLDTFVLLLSIYSGKCPKIVIRDVVFALMNMREDMFGTRPLESSEDGNDISDDGDSNDNDTTATTKTLRKKSKSALRVDAMGRKVTDMVYFSSK